MGVLCDFFIATDEELFNSFKGWKRPAPLLDQPVARTVINPFTRAEIKIETRKNPVQPVADADAVESGDFRGLPWIDQKGILTTEMAQLAEVLMSWPPEYADDEIHGRLLIGPEATSECVGEVPLPVVGRLASLTPPDCIRLGTAWSARHREGARTIKSDGTRESQLARRDGEWIDRLTQIAKLASRAIADHRGMFIWMAP